MTKSNFAGVVLPEALQHTLLAMGYKTATPIQEQAIPVAMEGKDILGTAQTGTGKTAAFGIPLVAKIMSNDHSCALVMLPTRELAMQVMDIIGQMLGKQSKIKRALLIGGASMGLQLRDLKNNPRIIVGTPGRINDHLKRRTLNLTKTDFLVLDETDRMLDMGFSVQIDKIIDHLPDQRQTLMFSATMPANIIKLAGKDLKNPVRITIGSTTSPILKIKQDVIYLKNDEKYPILLEQLEKRQGSVIIFVKTKRNTDKLGVKLKKDGHSVDVIHGDLRQGQRKRVIDSFRDMDIKILVATDVASRGLDIPHIEHVINYDLPQVPEDYIHRIGRTARNGQEGSALCLISPDDKRLWRAIERMMDPNAKQDAHDEGKSRDYKGAKKPRYKAGFKDKRSDDRKSDKPFGDRKKTFGDKKKSWGDKKEGSFGERKTSSDTGFGEKNRPEKKTWEKKPWDKKRDDNFGNKKPDGKEADGNRTYGEKKPWGKTSNSGERRSDDRRPASGNTSSGEKKPWEKKPWDKSGKPGEKRSDDRRAPSSRDGKPGEKKPWDKKPWDKKKSDGKKFGDRKPSEGGGEKKHWDKKDDGKKFNKPFGTPKFNGQKKRDMNFEKNTGGR